MPSGKLYRRNKIYYFQIFTGTKNADGTPHKVRRSCGTDKRTVAEKILAKQLYKYSKNTYYIFSSESERRRLSEVCDAWLNYVEPRLKSEKHFRDSKAEINAAITALEKMNVYLVNELTMNRFDAVVLGFRNDGKSTVSINKIIATFKRALNFAVERNFIERNALATYKRLPNVPVKNRRELKDDEVKALLDVSSPNYAKIWQFILSTGLRSAEFTNLAWDNVDTAKSQIRVAKYKGFSPKSKAGFRTITVDRELLGTRERHGEYVFYNEAGNKYRGDVLIKAFKRAMFNALCKLQNLPYGDARTRESFCKNYEKYRAIQKELFRLDLHSLRYTFCTGLIRAGVDPKTVQTVMGHSSPAITLQIYAQYSAANADKIVGVLPYFQK